MMSDVKISATLPLQQSETELINGLLQYAADSNYAFALWRLPEASVTNLILSYSPEVIENKTLEELPEGFIFSPFDKTQPGYFLKADLFFSFRDNQLQEPTTPLQSDSFNRLIEIVPTISPHKISFKRKTAPQAILTSGKEDFERLVEHGVRQIEAGYFEKVVPSRLKSIALPASFDVVEAFQKLCVRYPNAMVSLVNTAATGTWIGASPEVLVSVENNHIFRTIALAGTKAFEDGLNLKQVAWTQKEIEEQALVSRYIINCFKKIRLREFEEHGPKTVVAGNLMHLKTDFAVDMKLTNFPQLGSVMLQLLHPTSAVCGMPLETSFAFLKQHEGYDRAFYSGYLGPVNIQNNINIYVNLRCMQLFEDTAFIYAGAGVTVDSIPSAEWLETEMKMDTLIKVIL
jgi:isochorismate synthase